MLLAGAGRAAINLDGVLPHDGFEAILDPLHVRALVFCNPDESRACLASVDATSLRDDRALREEVARTVGCAQENVWITATHSFSTPHVRTPEHLPSDEARARNALYAQHLVEAVHAACVQAQANMAPVALEVAKGPCSINANRDVLTPDGWWLGVDPTGFSDRSVRVLRLFAKEGNATIATLFTVDVQANVVQGLRDAQGRLLISADLAGAASAALEREVGGVAIFLVGAAGDQTTRVHGAGALPELAATLSTEVKLALSHAAPLEAKRLELARQTVVCPAQRRHDFASLAPTRSYTFEEAGTQDTLLSMARLGNLTVVGLQPEVNSAFGAHLRNTASAKLEVLTMVNGAQKYLPSSEAYDRITYEAMNSGFARGADEVLEQAIQKMIG